MDEWHPTPETSIPVGTDFRAWWFVVPAVVSVLSLVAAAVACIRGDGGASLFLLMAGAGLLTTLVAGLFVLSGRRWIEIQPLGFRITDLQRTRDFTDAQITDLALSHSWQHAGGKPIGHVRKLTLWIQPEGQNQQIVLVSRIPMHGADPLDPFIDRICYQAIERAEAKLAARSSVQGDQWRIEGDDLHLLERNRQQVLPLSSLAVVERIGGDVRIWQIGAAQAVASLTQGGKNTWLLEHLLPPRIPTPLAISPPPTSPPDDLGRVLFERRTGAAGVLVCAGLGVGLGGLAALFVWLGLKTGDGITLGIGLLLATLCCTCLLAGARLRKAVLRCHEKGLERLSMTGQRRLPFDAVEVFSFESRRNYSHGRYTGTTYTLVFAGRSREIGDGIFYSTTVRNLDEELEELRDRAALHLARRMARTYARHAHVQWTPELWFRGSHLEFQRRRRWFATPRPVVVPLEAITTFEVREDWFYAWTNYQERAVISIRTSSPNFFAGIVLFQSLMQTHGAHAAERPQEHRGLSYRT